MHTKTIIINQDSRIKNKESSNQVSIKYEESRIKYRSIIKNQVSMKKAYVLALNTAHALRLNKADVLALNKAHVLRLNSKICPVFRANTKEAPSATSAKGGDLRPPPFVVSFVLALNTGHILSLRRKTCALLRAKTSALLRRKTCAVLRAFTYAFFIDT